jgi:hypothetical protein
MDQLSRTHSLDKYRIRSIKKLLKGNLLTEEQRKLAVKVMTEKCLLYAKGCRKRGRCDEALEYEVFV